MSELIPGLIRFELMIFLVLEVRLKKFWVDTEGVTGPKGVAGKDRNIVLLNSAVYAFRF